MNTPTRIATALIGAQVTMAAAFGLAMPAHAHAYVSYPPCAHAGTGPGVDVPCGFDGHVYLPANMVRCAQEDGNPDGLPCLWVDPDTGDGYFVTSENYR